MWCCKAHTTTCHPR